MGFFFQEIDLAKRYNTNPQKTEVERFLKPATVVDFYFFTNNLNASFDKIGEQLLNNMKGS